MDQTIVAQYSLIAAAFILGLASIAAAFSDSKAASHALEGMTRQPEMASKLFTNIFGCHRPYRIYSDYCYRYRSGSRIR